MISSARLRAGAIAAVTSVVLLGACAEVGGSGTTDPPTSQDTAASETAEAPVTEEPQLVEQCTAAPSLPSAPPTFDQDDAPSHTPPDRLYATVTTNCGVIEYELLGDLAPDTVASFEGLAQAGYWADSPCHRLTTSGLYVLQCGDPTGTGRGGPGYTFGIENAPADGMYPRGSIAMARTQDPNSNGGQYFIVYQDTMLPTQGGGYSIFGNVISGMDVIDLIAEQGVGDGSPDGAPAQRISVLSVEVSEQRASESE